MGKRGLWQVQRGEAWLLKLREKSRSFYSTDNHHRFGVLIFLDLL